MHCSQCSPSSRSTRCRSRTTPSYSSHDIALLLAPRCPLPRAVPTSQKRRTGANCGLRPTSICVSKDDQQLTTQVGVCAALQSLPSAVPSAKRCDRQQTLFAPDSFTKSLRRAPRHPRNPPKPITSSAASTSCGTHSYSAPFARDEQFHQLARRAAPAAAAALTLEQTVAPVFQRTERRRSSK